VALVGKGNVMTGERDIRVGFLVRPDHWLGGKNYLRNLFSAIRVRSDRVITPVIFTGMRSSSAAADFPGIEVVRSPILDDRRSAAWFVRKVVAKVSSQDRLLRRLLEQHNVSILSHSFHLGIQSSIATIGWIPDFQHLHLPEFFSLHDRQLRDREFMEVCAHSDRIILSSECARADLQAFAPEHVHKAALLRFVASPMPLNHAVALQVLQREYSFEKSYFLLPNQFWAHKNHRVVISALQILRSQNRNVTVLSTGVTNDYRHPQFFSDLMKYAKECDVLDSFRVLGVVPFDHLVGLMRHSIAFINPSKFEGWSTSVEEAKSMGKQVVLSDIAVHREQAPDRGFFFPAEDPEALAEAMLAAYHQFDELDDFKRQEVARIQYPDRLKEFGNAYAQIALNIFDELAVDCGAHRSEVTKF
jgi:glycosyltransferase involved in cell wall biosynthesis